MAKLRTAGIVKAFIGVFLWVARLVSYCYQLRRGLLDETNRVLMASTTVRVNGDKVDMVGIRSGISLSYLQET